MPCPASTSAYNILDICVPVGKIHFCTRKVCMIRIAISKYQVWHRPRADLVVIEAANRKIRLIALFVSH